MEDRRPFAGNAFFISSCVTTKKADCIRAIDFSPQSAVLGCSELAVIERGIVAPAGKQPLMGTAFDDIAVFHV